jgi:hypothetical protein
MNHSPYRQRERRVECVGGLESQTPHTPDSRLSGDLGLLRRHRAAMAVIHQTDPSERLSLLAAVVAPSKKLEKASQP